MTTPRLDHVVRARNSDGFQRAWGFQKHEMRLVEMRVHSGITAEQLAAAIERGADGRDYVLLQFSHSQELGLLVADELEHQLARGQEVMVNGHAAKVLAIKDDNEDASGRAAIAGILLTFLVPPVALVAAPAIALLADGTRDTRPTSLLNGLAAPGTMARLGVQTRMLMSPQGLPLNAPLPALGRGWTRFWGER